MSACETRCVPAAVILVIVFNFNVDAQRLALLIYPIWDLQYTLQSSMARTFNFTFTNLDGGPAASRYLPYPRAPQLSSPVPFRHPVPPPRVAVKPQQVRAWCCTGP